MVEFTNKQKLVIDPRFRLIGLIVFWYSQLHCHQRAPIENVSSTSGILGYSDISIDRNDFDAGFLITFRKNVMLHCKKQCYLDKK
jgi:hypothetical protein